MDIRFLLTVALVAIAVFFAVWAFTHAYEWIVEKWWEGQSSARERERHRADQQTRAASQAALVQIQQYQQQLIARGHSLLNNDPERGASYQDIVGLYGMMSQVGRVLGRHSKKCFPLLLGMASALGGSPGAYEIADQDAERMRAQYDVQAIVAAALKRFQGLKDSSLLDSDLLLWKMNLLNISNRVCACCPVVDSPGECADGCPVMKMTRKVRGPEQYGQTANDTSR